MTLPNVNGYSWDLHHGLASFQCRVNGSHVAELSLVFNSVEEAESFATAASQMAQDYRLSLEDRADVESLFAEDRPAEAKPRPDGVTLSDVVIAEQERRADALEASLDTKREGEAPKTPEEEGSYRVGHSAGIPF
jgi:hypothetical protein